MSAAHQFNRYFAPAWHRLKFCALVLPLLRLFSQNLEQCLYMLAFRAEVLSNEQTQLLLLLIFGLVQPSSTSR